MVSCWDDDRGCEIDGVCSSVVDHLEEVTTVLGVDQVEVWIAAFHIVRWVLSDLDDSHASRIRQRENPERKRISEGLLLLVHDSSAGIADVAVPGLATVFLEEHAVITNADHRVMVVE